MKFKSACLIAITIIASFAIVSALNTNTTLVGGNNEGVNATVFGIFKMSGDSTTYVDVFIDANASVSSQVKIVDTDGVIHSGSDMNKLSGDKYIPGVAGRYICLYYLENPIKIKYARVESTSHVRGEYERYDKELTPFLINLNETPSTTFPSVGYDGYVVYSLKYSLDAASNTTIHNISIIPDKFYQIAYDKGVIGWVLGMKLENIGANPQSIKPSDFKFEDQYGWKYRANMWLPYNFNEEGNTFFNYELATATDSDKEPIKILPGETLRVALRFGEVSMLSMPSALEYINGSMKINNVTSEIVPDVRY